MKPRTPALLLFLLWISCSPPAAGRDTLLTLSDQWMQAMTENDIEALDSLLTDDFYLVLFGRRYGRIPKPEWMSNVGFYDHLRFENQHITTLDSTSKIISQREYFTVSEDAWYQPTVKTWAPVIDIWVQEDGRWRVKKRLVGDWSLFLWWDRGIGFVAGIAFFGLLLLFRRLFRGLRQRRSGKTTEGASG